MLSCGSDLPAFFLTIEAGPGVGPLTSLDVYFLVPGVEGAATAENSFYYEHIDLGPEGLGSGYTLRVEVSGDSAFVDEALASVTGLDASGPVANGSARLELADKAETTLTLFAIAASCDEDGDGFKDCSRDGCCSPDEQASFSDCDDADPLVFPLAKAPACRDCRDTDEDGVDDCVEVRGEIPCDPDDASSYPGAPEICDSRDNDCDGETDEGLRVKDWDGQVLGLGASCGTGACADGTVSCSQGQILCSTVFVRAPEETPGNGIDDDCNGATDEGSVADDSDGDGVSDADEDAACDAENARFLAEIHPGAPEPCCPASAEGDAAALARCDRNCDGETSPCAAGDSDGDGFLALDAGGMDCDDEDPAIYPGAPEKCGDGVDQDCDGADLPCSPGVDADGDQFLLGTDCDDEDASSYPGGPELCDDRDNDCDGIVDEGNPEASDVFGVPLVCGKDEGVCEAGAETCYHAVGVAAAVICIGAYGEEAETCNALDDDCDGVTDNHLDSSDAGCPAVGVCTGLPIATCVQGSWACDFGVVSDYEAEELLCDGLDNDCDGATDEDLSGPALAGCVQLGVCFEGFSAIQAACLQGAWACDYSGVPAWQQDEDFCDSLDNDCDGETDEGQLWTDWDGSTLGLSEPCGTGACASGTVICDPVSKATSCSSLDQVEPERCDSLDNNCDGEIDEGFTWNSLAVGEPCLGVGACGPGTIECLPGGLSATCSSNENGSASGATAERCDALDNDCDGETDEGLDTGAADVACKLEGVCTPSAVSAVCDEGGTWICDYSGIETYQADAETLCDGLDNDCDGQTDEDMRYANPGGGSLWLNEICVGQGTCGTGVVECNVAGAMTCSSSPDGSSPQDQEESCDGLDNDCDGLTDEDFDWLGFAIGEACDGVGECGAGAVECAGLSASTCSTNPDGSAAQGGVEICNHLDDDCDGGTDNGLSATSADSPCRKVGLCTVANVVATCAEGAWDCDYGNILDYEADTEQSCDGFDNDCDGAVDEDFLWTDSVSGAKKPKGASCGTGSCDGGVVVCTTDQTGLICSTDLEEGLELCDDKDNDCDGQTDEGLSYEDPVEGSFHALGEACDGVGECGAGSVECLADGGITCSTNPGASAAEDMVELCDALDNDCDGLTDEELHYAGLLLGEVCDGVGECGLGTVQCVPATAGTTCSTNLDGDAFDGLPEVCDGLDNNCDEATDEGLGLQDSDCLDVGVCATAGVVATCTGLGGWSCDYLGVTGYQASNELGRCDGLDNDCDGATDEDYPELTSACDGSDADSCANGLWTCREDGSGVLCVGDEVVTEVCGGGDEDCDGETDEEDAGDCVVYYRDDDRDGFGLDDDGRCLCAPVAPYDTVIVGDCDDSLAGGGAAKYPNAPELCNGIDDDCDAQTDAEDASDLLSADSRACEDQDGVCLGAMKPASRCVDGAWQDCVDEDYLAHAASFEAEVELACDGLDNDCDDSTDEDFSVSTPDGTVVDGIGADCGVGACAGGATLCNAAGDGVVCDSADQVSDELCDGLDNDCDGATDAADADELVALEGVVGVFQLRDDMPLCEEQRGLCLEVAKPAALCVEGSWLSCDAATYLLQAPAYQAEAELSCDGLDNDCDGNVDEDFTLTLPDGTVAGGVAAPCGSGACAGGETYCLADESGISCDSLDQVADELCDGIDNDCDGLTDLDDSEDLAAADSQLCEEQRGVCDGAEKPLSRCQGGAWQVCEDADYLAASADYEAGTELSCDALDNDCDGDADEDFELETPDGASVSGVGTDCGVGACAGGTTACDAEGTGILCSSLGEISEELCNQDDDDCDGLVDAADSDLTGPVCGVQFGVCAGAHASRERCIGGSWGNCSINDYAAHSEHYAAGPEGDAARVCDGYDNNCNNLVDENYASSATTCGVGACAATGTLDCVEGVEVDSCQAGVAAEDDSLCNGIDDDCDESTDEDFETYETDCGIGLCAAKGLQLCLNGALSDSCVPSQPTNEICDGFDNDCDGYVDADDPTDLLTHDVQSCALTQGVCTGLDKPAYLCSLGEWQDCDNAIYGGHDGRYEEVEVSCDGADNDCDGQTDPFPLTMPDGVVITAIGQACGVGACAAGVSECNDAGNALTCSTLDAFAEETCDDVDNNCNGLTDEYLGEWTSESVDTHDVKGRPSMAIDGTGLVHYSYYRKEGEKKNLHYNTYSLTGGVQYSGTITEAGDIGELSAIAVDASNTPHVIYLDKTEKELRYTVRVAGVWSTPLVIDDSPSLVVHAVSLAVTPAGIPHMAYFASSQNTVAYLRYATLDEGEVVDETADPGTSVGESASIRVDPMGRPHVAYFDQTLNALKYAVRSDEGWQREHVTSHNSLAGYSCSLALDAQARPVIAYFAAASNSLRVARHDGQAWGFETAATNAPVQSNGTSVAVDPVGGLHISYYANTSKDQRYATNMGGSWSDELVDSDGTTGVYSTLALTPAGELVIVCRNSSDNDLRLSKLTCPPPD